MTDDIVIRLREDSWHVSVSQGIRATMLNGADEIERLREQVAEYKNLYLLRSRLGDAVGGV